MALPEDGELGIRDLQAEAFLPRGNTNSFQDLAEVYDIDNYTPESPLNITLADDFYGKSLILTATSIQINPTVSNIPNTGGQSGMNFPVNVTVTPSNGSFLLVGMPTWLLLETNTIYYEGNQYLRFLRVDNSALGSVPRTATIKFLGSNNTYLATLTVTQEGNPVSIGLTPSNPQTLPQTQGTFTQDIEVTNPIEVSGVVTGDGMTLSSPIITDLGQTSRYRFTLTHDPNPNTSTRNATISFSLTTDEGYEDNRTIIHTQAGFVSELSISPTGTYDFNINGETKAYTITSNDDWESRFNSNSHGGWEQSFSQTSGFTTSNLTGNGDDIIYVRALNNSAGGTEDRSASLSVLYSNSFKQVYFTQDGNPFPTYTYSDADISGFAVATSGTVTPPSSNSGATISVVYSSGYSSSTNKYPLVQTNTPRTANVTVTVPSTPDYANYPGTVFDTETTTQEAAEEFINLIYKSPSNSTLDPQGQAIQFDVETDEELFNTEWVVDIESQNPDGNWVFLMTTSGQGNGTVNASVGGNYTGQTGYNGFFRAVQFRVRKPNGTLTKTIDYLQQVGTAPVYAPTVTLSPGAHVYSGNSSGTNASKTFTATRGGGVPTSAGFTMYSEHFAFHQTDSNVTVDSSFPPFHSATVNNKNYSQYSVGVYPINPNDNVGQIEATVYVNVSNSGGPGSDDSLAIQSGQTSWVVNPSPELEVSYTSGTSTITLTTNLSWTATLTNSTYSSFSLSGGDTQSGTGNKTFSISYGFNNRTADVTGTLVLESTTAGTSESTTITLRQTPQPPELYIDWNNSGTFTRFDPVLNEVVTINTTGQSIKTELKHIPANSGTVTWQASYESSPHVGISTTSDSSGGSGDNSVTAQVGATGVVRYLNFAENTTTNTRTATIQISSNIATNNDFIINTSQAGTSGGGGDPTDPTDPTGPKCLLKGTMIKMSNGSSKKVEDIVIGDLLMSKRIEGLPINNESEAWSWEANELNLSNDVVTVTSNTMYKKEVMYSINDGELILSGEHRHLIKRNGIWKFIYAQNIKSSDIMINDIETEVVVSHVQVRIGYYSVYKLDVEENDLYFANGYLTHNAKFEPEA